MATSKKELVNVTFLKNGISFGYGYAKGDSGKIEKKDLKKMMEQNFVIPANSKDVTEKRG